MIYKDKQQLDNEFDLCNTHSRLHSRTISQQRYLCRYDLKYSKYLT